MPNLTTNSLASVIREARPSERGPSMFFMALDIPFQGKRAVAAYMFRYIALPAWLWRRLTSHNLEDFAAGDPDFFQRPSHSPEVVRRMRQAHEELMLASNEVLLHEISHHEGLRTSCFWLYVNLCLGARRLLFTYAIGKKQFTPILLKHISNLYRDIFTIKQVLVQIDERRQWLKENSIGLQATHGPGMKEILDLYVDTAQLRGLLYGARLKLNASVPRKLIFPKTLLVFLRRHWKPILRIGPYIVRRLLTPSVAHEFTIPLIRNLALRGGEVTNYPVIRTFLPDGRNTSLDPQAVFVDEGMCATTIEAFLLREKFSREEFHHVCWWNYILILLARGDIFSDSHSDLAYRFISDYLYDTDAFGTELWALDRTVLNLLSRNAAAQLRQSLLEETLTHIEKQHHRFNRLSRQQIFTYVKHFFDHGA